MKPTIISIQKRNGLKFTDYQDHPGIYTNCPDCGGNVVHGSISCPDEINGCCVAHWGFGCQSCKCVFDVKYNLPDDGRQKEPLKFYEEVGSAIINPRGIRDILMGAEPPVTSVYKRKVKTDE